VFRQPHLRASPKRLTEREIDVPGRILDGVQDLPFDEE
jgi:hypothetical protein